MELIESLYPEEDLSYLQPRWEKFKLFSPHLSFLKYKPFRTAINNGNQRFILDIIEGDYLPNQPYEVLQEQLIRAINRGVRTLNSLCGEYLTEDEFDFTIPEVPDSIDVFELLESARDEWIEARNKKINTISSDGTLHGEHVIDNRLLFSAYNKVRSLGLGYRVLMIDESPNIISSLENYPYVIKWFEDKLGFKNPERVDLDGLSHKWQTSIGIEVYGSEQSPARSRLKLLSAEGQLKYGSILMKMLDNNVFPDKIDDYTGIEFIVRDEGSVKTLVDFFRDRLKLLGQMEDYKKYTNNGERKNEHSNPSYEATKFNLRLPVLKKEQIPGHPLGNLLHSRELLEVQILTLEADRIRRYNPETTHAAYKSKRFGRVFPIWFPRRIYEPLIRENLKTSAVSAVA